MSYVLHFVSTTIGEIESFDTISNITHRGRDKITTLSQTTISNTFIEWKCSLKLPLKFVAKFPMNNIPAVVQVMAWRRDKETSNYLK